VTPLRRRLAFFSAVLAAIAAVLGVVLSVTTASAAVFPGPGTRVGASRPVMILGVGADRSVSAGEGRGDAGPGRWFAVGARVAPEAVVNEGVNSVSNIGAGSAARSAETIAGAEPGSAFSGVYDPGRVIHASLQKCRPITAEMVVANVSRGRR
jgi:hypothetical protein